MRVVIKEDDDHNATVFADALMTKLDHNSAGVGGHQGGVGGVGGAGIGADGVGGVGGDGDGGGVDVKIGDGMDIAIHGENGKY